MAKHYEEYFENNWKTKVYFQIIEAAKQRGYGDANHHILPRSMGGSNKKINIVALTNREHFIVHYLLTKMCISKTHQYKMCSAFWRMNNSVHKEQKNTSRTYEIARNLFSQSQKGRKNYNLGGYTWSEEQKMNARGKRPHVNQTGENNNAFQGYYITPWGTFASSLQAQKAAPYPISFQRIIGWCKQPHKVITSNASKYKGLSSFEMGFYFVRVNNGC